MLDEPLKNRPRRSLGVYYGRLESEVMEMPRRDQTVTSVISRTWKVTRTSARKQHTRYQHGKVGEPAIMAILLNLGNSVATAEATLNPASSIS